MYIDYKRTYLVKIPIPNLKEKKDWTEKYLCASAPLLNSEQT